MRGKGMVHLSPWQRIELVSGPGRRPEFGSLEEREAAWAAHRDELLIDPRTGEPWARAIWAEIYYGEAERPPRVDEGTWTAEELTASDEMVERRRVERLAANFPERDEAYWRQYCGWQR